MAMATNENLHTFAPEVFDQGVDDWSSELALAETDVISMIRIKYWNRYENPSDFNSARLTASQWQKSTVYKALYGYILPKLSTFRPEGDPFREQLTFYKERFNEEFDMQFGLGIDYDKDGSGSVDPDTEVDRIRQDRLYR
jgi:hypothetical protein